MDEQCLEKVVSKEQLKEKGFRQKGNKFYRVTHRHIICYYEVAENMYALNYVERFERHILGDERE